MQQQSAPSTDISAAAQSWQGGDFAACALLIAALTALRLIGLTVSTVDLYFDEAQYWAWAQRLEWGYFSKPPLIAWVIALAEAVCGSGEACVRAPSAILYAGTSLVVFALARTLYDTRTAFWSALAIALATGTAFSARIVSTDVPLLFFWSVALLSLAKLLRGGGWIWSVMLGAALGLGMLSKYAMAYFFLCLLIAAFFDAQLRGLLTDRRFLAALALVAVLIAPNLYWNATNGMTTFSHTVDNAAGAGAKFSTLKMLEFVAVQFAIAGPVVFGAYLVALTGRPSTGMPAPDRLLVAFSTPILLLVTGLAFLTGAHPNWAAPALIAATILAMAWLLRYGARKWLAASFIFAGLMQLLLLAGDAAATRVTVPGLTKPDLYEPSLGWKTLATEAAIRAREAGATTIAAERRADVAILAYNLRHLSFDIRAWPLSDSSGHYFEMRHPLGADAREPVLLITQCPRMPRLGRDFSEVRRLAPIAAPSGPTTVRRYYAFLLSGRKADLRPLAPCS